MGEIQGRGPSLPNQHLLIVMRLCSIPIMLLLSKLFCLKCLFASLQKGHFKQGREALNYTLGWATSDRNKLHGQIYVHVPSAAQSCLTLCDPHRL